MIAAIVRGALRAGYLILRTLARGQAGQTGRRPGSVPGLNIPIRSFSESVEQMLQSQGFQTERIGPLVWIVEASTAPQTAEAAVPPMHLRDP